MTDHPGVYALDEAAYHADPCPAPSLSASIAAVLLDQSPRHAWTMHPRLNPNHQPEHKREFDIGHAAHTLMLGEAERFEDLLFLDYRTKAAQEARDAAYKAGRIPILHHQLEQVRRMVDAGRAQLAAHETGNPFSEGKAEQTLIWREEDIWCRARLDFLPRKPGLFYDYKTTTDSAHPDAVQRRLFGTGADVQAAFYQRGIKALGLSKAPRFRFVVQELTEPFALSVVELDPGATDLAENKVEEALSIWQRCLKSNSWPGYPSKVCYVDPPAWEMNKQVARENRRVFLRDQGTDDLAVMLDWQRPL